jgi:hypothetical protein
MLRKVIPALLIIASMIGGVVTMPNIGVAHAQDTSNSFTVSIEITGIVASIVPQSNNVYLVTLQDGTAFLVNSATTGNATVVPGQWIIAVAELNDATEQGPLTAKTLDNYTPSGAAAPTATFIPTQLPTPTAVVLPTRTTKGSGPATQSAACAANEPDAQPVARWLAIAFGVPYEEIMSWHCRGFGFGEIARAYLLDEYGTLTVDDIFNMRLSGVGWGQIMHDADVTPSELAPGQVIKAHDVNDDHGHKKPAKPKKPKKVKGNDGKNKGDMGDMGGMGEGGD